MARKKKKGGTRKRTNTDLTKASSYQVSTKKQNRSTGTKKKGGLLSYLRGVKQELKKVVWSTKEELTTNTIVVIVCVIFFSFAFWLIDTSFLAALKGILGITLS